MHFNIIPCLHIGLQESIVPACLSTDYSTFLPYCEKLYCSFTQTKGKIIVLYSITFAASGVYQFFYLMCTLCFFHCENLPTQLSVQLGSGIRGFVTELVSYHASYWIEQRDYFQAVNSAYFRTFWTNLNFFLDVLIGVERHKFTTGPA